MAVVEDKISFVLYGSYEEQLDMLTNEQAGKWIKSVYSYVRTGEKHSDDPMVAMLLSVTSHQLDIDARKYAERLERQKEAASKAGKISAQKRAQKRAKAENEEFQRLSTDVNDRQRFQHEDEDVDVDVYVDEDVDVDVYVDEDVDVDVYVDEDVDVDADVLDIKTGRSSSRMMKNACAREEAVDNFVDNIIMPYGKDTLPILASEFEHYKAFINGLTRKYMNRMAKDFDIRKAISYASRVEISPDDVVYAVFDDNQAELLEYAFERAAEQERMTWKYIDGIMENYQIRDVRTVRDAIMNECLWHENRPRF